MCEWRTRMRAGISQAMCSTVTMWYKGPVVQGQGWRQLRIGLYHKLISTFIPVVFQMWKYAQSSFQISVVSLKNPSHANSKLLSFLILKFLSSMPVPPGLQLGRGIFPIEPRYFHPVCMDWMKAFLIPMGMQPLTEDAFRCSPGRKLHRNYLTVFLCVSNIRFPRSNRFSDLLFTSNEETQGYLNLKGFLFDTFLSRQQLCCSLVSTHMLISGSFWCKRGYQKRIIYSEEQLLQITNYS